MDGVRGLAVVLVFFVHFHSQFGEWAPESWRGAALWVAEAGHSGVDLFFALSGFLIYGMLVEKQPPLGRFWRRRARRIYPAFLMVLAIYVALSYLVPAKSRIPAGAGPAAAYVARNALLLPGVFDIKPIITVAWSLSYEIFFYLGLPAVTAMAARWRLGSRGRMLLIGAIAAAAMVYVFRDPGRYYPSIPFSPLVLIAFLLFLPGMIAWEVRDRWQEKWTTAGPVAGAMGLVAAVTGIPTFMARPDNITAPLGDDAWMALGRALFVVASLTPFAVECFTRRGWLARAFEWAPLSRLGEMSYSFYLAHSLGLHLSVTAAKWIAPPQPSAVVLGAYFALSFAAALGVSRLLFVAVERPLSLRPGST